MGLISGAALNMFGQAQAGMGVAVGDYDGNGFFDIFVTNFAEDTNTLYQNLGRNVFLGRDRRSRERRALPVRISGGERASQTSTTTAGWICSSPTVTFTRRWIG